MNKHKYKQILAQIADQIILNIDFQDAHGLSDGRIGSLLFLYQYSEFKDCDLIFSFCNEQLLIVLDSLHEKNHSYHNGLAGIADALQFLHQENFIEIPDGNDFFDNINIEIMKDRTPASMDPDSLFSTLYLVDSLDPNSIEYTHQLDKLLYIEKACEQVDAIEEFVREIDFNTLPAWSLYQGEETLRLANLSKKLMLANEYLIVMHHKGIYFEVVDRCLSGLHLKNKALADLLLDAVWCNNNLLETTTHLYLLTNALNVLINSESKFIQNLLNYYIRSTFEIFSKYSLELEIDLSVNSIDIHVATVLNLLQINGKLQSNDWRKMISSYITGTLMNFDENKFCLDYLEKLNERPTLGVFGPAGLGFLLLIHMDEKFLNISNILQKVI